MGMGVSGMCHRTALGSTLYRAIARVWWASGLSPSPPIPLWPWQRRTYSDFSSDLPCICLIDIHHTDCQNHLKHRKENGLGRSSSWAKAPHLGVEQQGGSLDLDTHQEGVTALSLFLRQNIPIFKRTACLKAEASISLGTRGELQLLAGYMLWFPGRGASF